MDKDFILKHKALASVVQKLLLLKNYSAYKEVLSFKNAGLFDFELFVKDYPRFFTHPIPDNCCWGMIDCLKNYSGLKEIDAYIEHGYFWGKFVPDIEEKCFARKIITFSEHRKHYISEKCSKEVIPIGPYIHYAPDYIEGEEFEELKRSLKKTLLFVPSHAGTGTRLHYNIEEMLKAIDERAKDFDSKVVSLFWTDAINLEVVKMYKDAGFLVFCAGHRYDPYFLSRQKTMMKLSDLIVCNGGGTHIGYGVYLGKPIWCLRQNVVPEAINSKGIVNIYFEKQVVLSQNQEINYICDIFSVYSEHLTPKQIDAVNTLFGIDSIRDKQTLCQLLSN